MNRRLAKEQVFKVGKEFIKGRGYACRLELTDDILIYLIKNKYIEESSAGSNYYFLKEKFYNDYKNEINDLNFTKIEIELLKEYCAINVVYFDSEFMHMFLNNPNYHFTWDGYRGYVCSSENSKTDVYIKDLCLCHDLEDNKIVLGAFISDLIQCSEVSQTILQPYILDKDYEKYEFHHCNYKNLLLGEWLDIEELDIYTVILEGIKIVNYIFNKKYGFKLYKNEYSVQDLQFYMPLFFPTKINRFNFMMELAKIFLDNINGKSLKKLIKKNHENMSNKNDFVLEDLEKEEFREYKAFKTFFGQYKLFNKLSFTKLNEIRELRTEPAHKIYTNDIDYSYCKEQDEILKNLYRIIYNIIKVEDPDYKLLCEYQNGDYTCFFGKQGAISQYNGFNSKNYHYYNGFMGLNNDKFKVRDSEILIAGNSIKYIKEELTKCISSNHRIDMKVTKKIIDMVFKQEICIPSEKELKSFFYGNAYIKKFFGECDDYKEEGRRMYNEFCLNKYKYVYVFADSSDMYWDVDKTIKNIIEDNGRIFGSGFLLCGLSNNFASDDTNIFNKDYLEQLVILNNVWD